MTVGLLIVDCFLPGSLSLKAKRHILSSLVERVRREYNVSICEIEFQDQWQRSRLAVTAANTEWVMLERTLHRIAETLERDRNLNVLNTETHRLR